MHYSSIMKRIIQLSTTVLLCGLLFASAPAASIPALHSNEQGSPRGELLVVAYKKFKDNDFLGAIRDLDLLFRENDSIPSAWVLRGSCLLRLGNIHAAAESFERAISLDTTFAPAHISYAGVLADMGAPHDAMSHIEYILSLQPNNVDAYQARANALLGLHEYERAISDCKRVLFVSNDNISATFTMGMAYKGLGDERQFKECMEKVVHYFVEGQEEKEWDILLVSALVELNRLDEALKAVSVITEHMEQYAPGYIQRGAILLSLKRPSDAQKDFKRALRINPSYSAAYVYRGLAYEMEGDDESAEFYYSKAIELDPGNLFAVSSRANFYLKNGETEKLFADYSRAIELAPQNPALYNNRGNAHLYLGNYTKAVADYEQAIKLSDKNPHYHNNRGYALMKLGRYDESLASIDLALSLKPDYCIAHSNRLRVLLLMNRGDEALEVANILEQGCENEPGWVLMQRGKAQYQLGNYRKAANQLQEVLDNHLVFQKEAYLYLLRVYAASGQLDKVKALEQAMLADFGDDAAFIYEYALYYRDTEDWQSAIQYYDLAIHKIDPSLDDIGQIYYDRALARYHVGQTSLAMDDFWLAAYYGIPEAYQRLLELLQTRAQSER